MSSRLLSYLTVAGSCTGFLIGLGGAALAAPYCNAPEIDPSLMGSGLAILIGSVILVVERYRHSH